MLVTSQLPPAFHYERRGLRYTAWLKCPKDKPPHFDLWVRGPELTEGPKPEDIEPVEFTDRRCRIPAKLIRAFSRYFPYLPSDNYLENGGQPIA